MNDQLITKETAVLAKEKGFDVSSLNQYRLDTNGNFEESYHGMIVHDHIVEIIKRPTQSLLQRWLREVHNISIEVFSLSYHNKIQFTMNIKKLNKSEIKILSKNNYHFETYEEALEFGLQKALELL